MSPFVYDPLPSADAGLAHTRVFKLSPGSSADPIEGALVVVPFGVKSSNELEFECLSYTWGDASETAGIHVNGDLMRVTKSLYVALRRFRRPDRVRALWIDAICINQADDEEKSKQVRLMQHIYEDASRVLVWLGEASEGSEKAFAIFRRLLTSLGPIGLRKWRARKVKGPGYEPQAGERLPWEHDDTDNEQYYHNPLFESLKPFDVIAGRLQEWLPEDAAPQESDYVTDNGEVVVPIVPENQLTASILMARTFFTRVWIVQEIAVSREALVCCGADELDWWLLNLALGYLMTSAYRSLGNEAGMLRFTSISLTCHYLRSGTSSMSAPPASIALSILQHYRCCGATDKRDKIYALLGILKHMGVQTKTVPDYGVEARKLYIDFTRAALQSAGTLDILAIAHGQDESLPSWVPDWSDASPQPNLLFPLSTTVGPVDPKRKPYNASDGSNIGTLNVSQNNRLLLRGVQHDTLDRIGDPFHWLDGANTTTKFNTALYNWLQTRQKDDPVPKEIEDLEVEGNRIPLEFWKVMRQWHALGIDKAFDPYPFTGETAELALIRTLEGDHLPNGIEQPAKHWKHLWNSLEAAIQAGLRIVNGSKSAEDRQAFTAPAKLPGSVKEWDAPLYGLGNKRCLARTRLGYIALVGQGAQEGDSVVLLQGGLTPYIVRRKGEDWTFVSDAYVHGMMYGEAWDTKRCKDMVIV